MTNLLHADLTYYLRGVGFHIQNSLGSGHAEEDYEQALIYKLEADRVPFQRQTRYRVMYRGKQIGEYYPDITLADGKLQADLKVAASITNLHKAQLLSYLAVTGAELGFVMNFGAASMQYERLPNFLGQRVQTPPRPPPAGLLHEALTTSVLAALHMVHITLGPGFLHQIYRRATRIELAQVGLPFVFLKELPLRYASHVLSTKSTRFFWIEQKLLLATIAVTKVLPTHRQSALGHARIGLSAGLDRQLLSIPVGRPLFTAEVRDTTTDLGSNRFVVMCGERTYSDRLQCNISVITPQNPVATTKIRYYPNPLLYVSATSTLNER